MESLVHFQGNLFTALTQIKKCFSQDSRDADNEAKKEPNWPSYLPKELYRYKIRPRRAHVVHSRLLMFSNLQLDGLQCLSVRMWDQDFKTHANVSDVILSDAVMIPQRSFIHPTLNHDPNSSLCVFPSRSIIQMWREWSGLIRYKHTPPTALHHLQ